MSEALRYDAEGLRTFAAACEQYAQDVCIRTGPPLPTSGHQSTVDAVSALHAAATGTADVLANRLRSTTSALSSAADRYSRTEIQLADALDASIDSFSP